MPEPENVMAEDAAESTETLKDFVINHVNHFYINHIPFDSIKDMSSTYLYFFGTVAYIFSFCMFGYFFYDNYESSLNQAFISLQSDAGDCSSVPILIQGTYLADTKGLWSSQPSFKQVKAQYALKLAGFEISSNLQYNRMMEYFYENLQRMGQNAESNNLAENILLWMTYTQYYSLQFSITDQTFSNISSIGQVQSFSLTGNPSTTFNLDHLVGRLGSATGICPVLSYAQFDSANHVMQTTWTSYSDFASNSICTNAMYAQNFAYYAPVDDNIFNLKIDVESLAVAMSVNMQYVPLSFLTPVSSFTLPFLYKGITYNIGEYFDLRYSSMRSIYCLFNTTDIPENVKTLPQELCFLSYGSSFALPIFNPFGSSYIEPAACECGHTRSGNSDACNTFNFLVGIVFYKNTVNNDNIVKIFEEVSSGVLKPSQVNVTALLGQFGTFSLMENLAEYPSYARYNRQAYLPSFFTAYTATNATSTDIENAFNSFCRLSPSESTTTNDVCSMVVFNAYDESTHAVSVYKYQLRNGSCHNSIAIPPETWSDLVNTPPVQFTQEYFECYDNTRAAIVAAIGIAQGNTQTFLPFFVVIALPLLYFILVVIREVPPKEEYKEQEKNEVNEILALLLLRLRDGKTRGVKKQGVLMNLAKEVIAMAKEEGGYPDSDDESDEEEETSQEQEKGVKNVKSRTRVDSDDEFAMSMSEGVSESEVVCATNNASSNNSDRSLPRKAPKTLTIRGNKMIIEDNTRISGNHNNSSRSNALPPPSGNVVEQFRHIVNQRNRRKRMDVFTKHLVHPTSQTKYASHSNNNNNHNSQSYSTQSVGALMSAKDDSSRYSVDPHDRDTSLASEGGFRRSRMSSAAQFFRRVTSTVSSQQNPHHLRQLQRQQQQQQQQQQATSNNAANNNTNNNSSSFWSSIFGSNTTSTSHNNSTAHKQQEMQDRPSLVAVNRPTNRDNHHTSEKDKDFAKHIAAYKDLNLFAPPQEVQILNIVLFPPPGGKTTATSVISSSSTRSKKELSFDELNILLNDLTRYLSEALHAPMRLDSTVHTGNSPQNPMHENKGGDESNMPNVLAVGQTHFRKDSVDGDVYHEITRRDHVAFQQQALPLSTRLTTQVDWKTVLELYEETERNAIALKLVNIMSMHASIEYGCAMSEVSTLYRKKVAYNIGQRLVTLYLLENLIA